MLDRLAIVMGSLWYLCTYGPPPRLMYLTARFFHFYTEWFTLYNQWVYPMYWDDKEDNPKVSGADDDGSAQPNKGAPKVATRYEDKYLDQIRLLSKDWVFTKDEHVAFQAYTTKHHKQREDDITQQLRVLSAQIHELEKENEEDTDMDIVDWYKDEDATMEERNEYRTREIKQLQADVERLQSEQCPLSMLGEALERARQDVIQARLDKLTNSYVMEKTPVGNVIMMYQCAKDSFTYYSDSNVPYRYLEVVARKYVKMFDCRPLYVDMEEELRLVEEEQVRKADALATALALVAETKKVTTATSVPVPAKKTVFAKFKTYNKDAGSKIAMVAPPKNSIPTKNVCEDKGIATLKERANRYTYEGKFANFSFLKKVERKVFNKKLGVSFADFKKAQNPSPL